MTNLNHREFLKSLSAAERLELTGLCDFPAAIRLATVLIPLLINSVFLLSADTLKSVLPMLAVSVMQVLSVVSQGILLMCLFHLMHECTHNTVFTRQWLNRLVANVCGFVLFLPAQWFYHFHHAHHRYTQDENRDPELATPKPDTYMRWMVHMSGLTIWWASAKLFAKALAEEPSDDFIPKKKRRAVRREILLQLAVYVVLLAVCLMTGSKALFWIWLLPLLVGQPFLRAYLLAEHGGCDKGTNMFANTRTVFTLPLVRWLTWNMSYHTEHHVYPTVPFHRLPKLHDLMKGHLVKMSQGYLAFNREYLGDLQDSGA